MRVWSVEDSAFFDVVRLEKLQKSRAVVYVTITAYECLQLEEAE